MATPRRCLSLVMVLPVLMSMVGCASLQLPWSKDRLVRATARNPAVQVLCLWQSSTGRDPEGLPCRGFAGQIIFLSGGSTTPLAVDGDVRIYVFDDQGTLEERSVPRMWDFDSAAWNMHLTNSSLGPAYSVFIPYTRPGSQQASCTIRLRLTPKDGQPLFSETASIILPGKKVVDSIEQATDGTVARAGGNVWTSEEAKLAVISNDSRGLRKTTIPLNPKQKIREEQNGVVQEAAFAVPAEEVAAADPVQARLDRLEQLLEQTLARQQASPPAAESGIVQAAYESISPEGDSNPPGTSSRTIAKRPSFRGDRNSGSPAGDGVSEPEVLRPRHETHPLAADGQDDLPAPPRRLRVAIDPEESRARHPLTDE